MKRHLLLEMPWISDITCPMCEFNFDADCRVENSEIWPYTVPIRKKIINLYMNYRLFAMDCPNCNTPLLYSSKTHKTGHYEPRNLQKLSKEIKSFLHATKDSLTKTVKQEIIKKYDIEESINFKDYCKIIELDKAE